MYEAIPKRLLAYLVLFCTFSMFANTTVFAAEISNPMSKALDGMQFIGQTGEQGKGEDHADTISFEGGKFQSRHCVRFVPGPYSVEKHGDIYKFSSTMVSTDRGALEWKGTITGNKVIATYRWKHNRWFWSIERDYWYKGTRPSSQQ